MGAGHRSFRDIAVLLSCTTVVDRSCLEKMTNECIHTLEIDDKSDRHTLQNTTLPIISILTRNEENCRYIISTLLPEKVFERILFILAHVSGDKTLLRSQLSALIVLIDYFLCSADSPLFRTWIGHPSHCTFLKPLIVFLCSAAYLEKCLLAVNLDDRGLLLSDIHSLQSLTVMFIRKLVSCNLCNQKVFVDIIKDVLFKENFSGMSINNNSFLKRLVLQVILEEPEVTVVVTRADSTQSREINIAGYLNKNIRRSVVKRLRLSDPLSMMFRPTKTKKLTKKSENGSAAAAGTEPLKTSLFADNWADEGDWAEPADVPMLVTSAKYAAEKRQSKAPITASGSQEKSQMKYDMLLYNPLISENALPQGLTAGQVLHLLAANEHGSQNSSFVVRADIVPNTKGSKKRATEDCLLSSPSYPSLLRIFAADGGIEMLAKHNRSVLAGEFGKAIATSVGFILKFVTLTGFSDVFLKESKKAEYLLRLMLGVEETSEGGACFFFLCWISNFIKFIFAYLYKFIFAYLYKFIFAYVYKFIFA